MHHEYQDNSMERQKTEPSSHYQQAAIIKIHDGCSR